MYNSPLSFMPVATRPLFYLLLILDLVLKGIALYKSARRGQTIWFVALLLINSLGILPLIYLILSKDVFVSAAPAPKTTSRTTKRSRK